MSNTFTEYLLSKLSHLEFAYKTKEEFREHLLSGEVTIPITDAIKYEHEYNEALLLQREGEAVEFAERISELEKRIVTLNRLSNDNDGLY